MTLLLLVFRPEVASASIFGDVRGVVLDPQERPVPRAKVSLQSRTSSLAQGAQTSDTGEYLFRAVPLGDYVLTVEAPGFERALRTVTVTSDSAPVLKTILSLAKLAQTVDVVERSPVVGSDSPTPTTLVSREDIARAPGADRSNSLAMITNNVPGAYMIHDQLHVRGGHQVTWLVDGVPIPNTNIASNVGPQIDPKDIDYLEVQRGGYSAEFGDRTYAIFNVVPRTGFEYHREAEVVASYGSFGQTNDQVRLGGHGDHLAYYASVSGNRTNFGLAAPTAEVLHDHAHGLGAFTSLVYRPRPADQIRLVAAVRGDRYEVPNDPEAQAAGTADVASERDAFVNLSWVRTMGRGLLTVSPFYHFNRGDFLGGANDLPLVATDKHSSRYAGGQAVFSVLTAKHKATAGLFGFLQHDETLFALRPGDG
ncbi:MAG TPA: TonB-dependent receptor, partial [Vicinamibacteria bacterium]|nr:TonB-dependent receptor [Vicinamibacteria bacterium]